MEADIPEILEYSGYLSTINSNLSSDAIHAVSMYIIDWLVKEQVKDQ